MRSGGRQAQAVHALPLCSRYSLRDHLHRRPHVGQAVDGDDACNQTDQPVMACDDMCK